MSKIIIYKQNEEWLTINVSGSVDLTKLLKVTSVDDGTYYVTVVEDGQETDRTPPCDEKTVSRYIDTLLDHLLENGQEEEVNRLVDEIDVLSGHKKKIPWAFWACLGFLGFSVGNILYRTIFSFLKTNRVNPFIVTINLLLAIFLTWGIVFFTLKRRKQIAEKP
jgi:hypothetical protein